MGEETRTPVKEGPNSNSYLFERTIASKLKKMIESTMDSCIDDIDVSEEMGETMQEIMTEVLTENRFRSRVKVKINELLDEDAFIRKMATKVVNKMMGE